MVQPIIQQFDDLFKVLNTFDKENFYDYGRRSWMFYPHKGNVRVAATTWTEIADLWAAKCGVLRAWLTDYLIANKQTIYEKFYMDAAEKLIKDNLNHNWRFREADEEFITHCPDLGQWRMAEELIRVARARMDFSQCDDQEILHRHDGEPCNEGFICLLHEEMELDWCAKVEEELRSTDNIFLNVESRSAFAPIDTSWTGPAKPPISLRTFESIDGKTPFQAMKALIDRNWDLCSAFMYAERKTEYEIFIELWNKVDFIDEHIGTYMRQVAVIKNTL